MKNMKPLRAVSAVAMLTLLAASGCSATDASEVSETTVLPTTTILYDEEEKDLSTPIVSNTVETTAAVETTVAAEPSETTEVEVSGNVNVIRISGETDEKTAQSVIDQMDITDLIPGEDGSVTFMTEDKDGKKSNAVKVYVTTTDEAFPDDDFFEGFDEYFDSEDGDGVHFEFAEGDTVYTYTIDSEGNIITSN